MSIRYGFERLKNEARRKGERMQYLLLVMEHEDRKSMPDEERHQAYDRMMQFGERSTVTPVMRHASPV